MKRLDEYERNVNECQAIDVGYFHRWEVEHILGIAEVELAVPKLESGKALPRIGFEAILKCSACGVRLWYTHREPISVISKNCEVIGPS